MVSETGRLPGGKLLIRTRLKVVEFGVLRRVNTFKTGRILGFACGVWAWVRAVARARW